MHCLQLAICWASFLSRTDWAEKIDRLKSSVNNPPTCYLLYEAPTCQVLDLIWPRQLENPAGENPIYTFDNLIFQSCKSHKSASFNLFYKLYWHEGVYS